MNTLKTHYSHLQVVEDASPEVIKAAYKYLSQKYHPDRNPNDRVRCESIMQVLNEAYRILIDPELRKEYDEWIARLTFTHTYVHNRPCLGSAARQSPPGGDRAVVWRSLVAGRRSEAAVASCPRRRQTIAPGAVRRWRIPSAPRGGGGDDGEAPDRATRGQSGARRTSGDRKTRQPPDPSHAWRPADRPPQELSSGGGRRYPGGYSSRMPTRAAGR